MKIAGVIMARLASVTFLLAVIACAALSQAGTLDGASVPLGGGAVHSFVTTDETGRTTAVGVAFGAAALSGLPATSTELVLALPNVAPDNPFITATINWNPQGHSASLFSAPHFDLHFYMIDEATRMKIGPALDDPTCLAQPKDLAILPAGWRRDPECVAKMGDQWGDLNSPVFHGQPFTQIFFYGTYAGALAFLEPMITRTYLLAKPRAVVYPIAQPGVYPVGKAFPADYSIRYDAAAREYTISLEDMTRHQ